MWKPPDDQIMLISDRVKSVSILGGTTQQAFVFPCLWSPTVEELRRIVPCWSDPFEVDRLARRLWWRCAFEDGLDRSRFSRSKWIFRRGEPDRSSSTYVGELSRRCQWFLFDFFFLYRTLFFLFDAAFFRYRQSSREREGGTNGFAIDSNVSTNVLLRKCNSRLYGSCRFLFSWSWQFNRVYTSFFCLPVKWYWSGRPSSFFKIKNSSSSGHRSSRSLEMNLPMMEAVECVSAITKNSLEGSSQREKQTMQ